MDKARTIQVEGRGEIWALLFLEDGKHFLSGSADGMIRKWCIENGQQVGEPIKGKNNVRMLASSGDHKWIISGEDKLVTVWEQNTWRKVLEVRDHTGLVKAVDVSPCSTKFATGAEDKKANMWDIFTGRRLLGPLEHDSSVMTVKFSPDGRLLATAAFDRYLRIYDVEEGRLIRTIQVQTRGQSTIHWSSDSQRIFASTINNIYHIYVDTGSSISKWSIPGEAESLDRASLTIPTSGKFIAAFTGSSLSIWDPSTRERFGPVFTHPGQRLRSIALSLDNKYLVTSGDKGSITIRNLSNIIPMPYLVRQPRNALTIHRRAQIEAADAFRSILRTLEWRFDELAGTMWLKENPGPEAPAAPQVQHIPDGTYRIKSKLVDAYLTCPQDSTGMVLVQQLDASNDSQKWFIAHIEEGEYRILGRRGLCDVQLSTGNGNELVCFPDCSPTTFTFEPRGTAYVIGNAANAMALHLTERPQHVSTLLRDNSQNQRWTLERVHGNLVILEAESDQHTLCGS